jgi:hypothetical protein
VAFASFEENMKEYDRARVIYKYALDSIPKVSEGGFFLCVPFPRLG